MGYLCGPTFAVLRLHQFLLIGMGVQVDSEMNIWTAASDGNIELVKEWLEKIPVDSQDEQGYSCLHAAASYGHLDLLQLLVEKYKADLQLKDIEGDTALHLVEDLVTCKMLIELGADPTLRNNDGILVFGTNFSRLKYVTKKGTLILLNT